MKTPNTQVILTLIATLALLVSAGCASYKSYSGPSLPRNQIAILRLEHAPDSLRVSSVDGSAADLYPGASIQLLPGKHTFRFIQ
jgi:hypothetical protein